MVFRIPESKNDEIEAWVAAQDRAFAAAQGQETPYYGASGGSLTYEFTPTSLGTITRVRHNGTREVLDLTDYDNW